MRKTMLALLVALSLASATLVATVNADIGTGVLYVYTDSLRTVEAPKVGGQYQVDLGETYYIRISGITETGFNAGVKITVKISWTDINGVGQTTFFYDVEVKEETGVRFVDVDWTVPSNAKVCITSTVHYRLTTPEYVAVGLIGDVPGHMHIVPENPIGIMGSILAIFAAVGVFMLRRPKLPS